MIRVEHIIKAIIYLCMLDSRHHTARLKLDLAYGARRAKVNAVTVVNETTNGADGRRRQLPSTAIQRTHCQCMTLVAGSRVVAEQVTLIVMIGGAGRTPSRQIGRRAERAVCVRARRDQGDDYDANRYEPVLRIHLLNRVIHLARVTLACHCTASRLQPHYIIWRLASSLLAVVSRREHETRSQLLCTERPRQATAERRQLPSEMNRYGRAAGSQLSPSE